MYVVLFFRSVLLRDRPLAVAGHLTLSNRGLIKQSIFYPRTAELAKIENVANLQTDKELVGKSKNVCVFHQSVVRYKP